MATRLGRRHRVALWAKAERVIGAPDYGPFWSRSGVMFVQANSTTLGPTEYLPAIKAQGYGC